MKQIVIMFVLVLLPMMASADEKGTCGKNVSWSYSSATKTLTISGTGAMENYNAAYVATSAPWWRNYSEHIKTVIIESGVTSIGSASFESCSDLTSVSIPSSVTTIGGSAFSGCTSLTSIAIPDEVTSIGGSTFSGCTALSSVNIPYGVKSIDKSLFSDCSSLSSIAIPDGVTTIGGSAFWGCTSLTSITIPDKVTSIGDDAFNGCTGLTSVVIPNNVTSLGYSAFSDCTGLKSVIIGKGLKSLSYYVFDGCSGLTSIEIPNSVEVIEPWAFCNCTSLTFVEIPNSVWKIGKGAFAGCNLLTFITLPSSVSMIEDYAFNGCSSLATIVSLNIIPPSSETFTQGHEFDNVKKTTCTVWVPLKSVKTYRLANIWKNFQNIRGLVVGDVNIDNNVKNEDLDAMVDYIMGKDPINFYKSLADLNNDGKVNAADVVLLVKANSPDKAPAGVEAVDLGLPSGTKWANMNIGAEKPEDYGLFFAWGETLGYKDYATYCRPFDWLYYQWMKDGQSSESQINKYQIADGHTANCWYDSESNFIGDGKATLDLDDDAAYMNWGSNWRMPTYEDYTELYVNTTYTFTTMNGISGVRITSEINGKSIFLPASGDLSGENLEYRSKCGSYWISALYRYDSSKAESIVFDHNFMYLNETPRYYGCSVRPVFKNNP